MSSGAPCDECRLLMREVEWRERLYTRAVAEVAEAPNSEGDECRRAEIQLEFTKTLYEKAQWDLEAHRLTHDAGA
ncbi:MAG TPA: hypothetical protein VK789_08450 [Bryobacteraceae bacterium]|jgi:hypothetical protein|nr:hypothetical protein [Bryobacteraceae bacterium]